MTLATAHLLTLAQRLQGASSFAELLTAVTVEIEARIGYRSAWIYVAEDAHLKRVRLIATQGADVAPAWEQTPVLDVEGDPFLYEVAHSPQPVLVEDAATDPRTNKELVAHTGVRTIVNVPLRLLDSPFGVLSTGTFADEGRRLPSPEELEYLVQIASQLSVAAARIRLNQEREAHERERRALQDQLRDVQRLESLGLLAGGVAHDFNNLLTVILASVGLLAREPLSESQKQHVSAILEAGEKSAELVAQLLSLGRRRTMRVEAVEVGAYLERLLRLVRSLLPESIALRNAPTAAPLWVTADAAQLDQVLMNLCVNARDAMPEGGTLFLSVTRTELDADYVRLNPWAKQGVYARIDVTDTGHGMPPEVRERIFDPFFTTKAEGRGTGLGLAVSYGIVSQHGGLLHCYSEPGVGTSFKLYMPLRPESGVPVEARTRPPVRGGNERILVAEDQDRLRTLVGRMLEDAGYTVETVANGEEAVEAARRTEFDLALLDVVMPRMNGRSAYEEIRKLRPRTRFLFSSGYAGDALPEVFVVGAREDLLQKPYHADELLRAVRRALGAE
ncbi:MAG: ATP-binding protein [Polyangiales bacterium]